MTRDELHAIEQRHSRPSSATMLAWGERDIGLLTHEVRRLQELLNTPHTADFLEAVKLEAVHQRERWGSEHDEGKAPEDWFWLLGFLAGKAVHFAKAGDTKKALHHTISSAAVLLNWHAALSGVSNTMRPGIEPPAEDRP